MKTLILALALFLTAATQGVPPSCFPCKSTPGKPAPKVLQLQLFGV